MTLPVQLVGQAEAGRTLGVSREQIGKLVAAGRAPTPVAVRAGAPYWTQEIVALWKRARDNERRQPRNTKGTPR